MTPLRRIIPMAFIWTTTLALNLLPRTSTAQTDCLLIDTTVAHLTIAHDLPIPIVVPYRNVEEYYAHQTFGLPLYRTAGSVPLHTRRGIPPDIYDYSVDGVRLNDPYSGLPVGRISPLALKNPYQMIDRARRPSHTGPYHSSVLGSGFRFGHWPFVLEGISDNLFGSGYDQNWYTFATGGPIKSSSHAKVFGLLERRYLGDRDPSNRTGDILPDGASNLPGNWLDGWSYNSRLDWSASRDLAMNFSVNGSRDEYSWYNHRYCFNSPHMPYYKDEYLAFSGQLFSRIWNDLSGSMKVSTLGIQRFRGDGEKKTDLGAYVRPYSNPQFDRYEVLAMWDDADGTTPAVDESQYFDDYWRTKSRQWRVYGSLNNWFTGSVRSQLSVEWLRTTQRIYHNSFPTSTAGLSAVNVSRLGYDLEGNEIDDGAAGWMNEKWRDDELTFVLSTRVGWHGFWITPKVEWKRFSNNGRELINPEQPLDPYGTGIPIGTLDFEDTRDTPAYSRLAPGVMAWFRFNDEYQLFADAGVKYHRQPIENQAVDWGNYEERLLAGSFQIISAPALEPVKIEDFDLGLRYHGKGSVAGNVTASVFSTTVSNRTATVSQSAFPNIFVTTVNTGRIHTEGLELSMGVESRYRFSFLADLAYWSKQTTTLPSDVPYYIAWKNPSASGIRSTEFPGRHDGLVLLRAQLKLQYFRDDGPKLAGAHILENTRVGLALLAHNGARYTPTDPYDAVTQSPVSVNSTDLIHSERGPAVYTLDFNIERTIRSGETRVIAFLWIRNLLNIENIYDVYSGTGEPDNTGYLSTPEGMARVDTDYLNPGQTTGFEDRYLFTQQDPLNYGQPRQIFLGLRVILQ